MGVEYSIAPGQKLRTSDMGHTITSERGYRAYEKNLDDRDN